MIAVEKLSQRFGGVRALENISFSVDANEIVGLVGPQGSGKTTTVDILAGAAVATSGTVSIAGERIDGLPAHAVASRGVARTFQAPRLFARHTALENVVAGSYRHSRDGFGQRLFFSSAARADAQAANSAARTVLASLGLGELGSADVRHLSEGERRRVEIARAIASRSMVLLLDEPLSGLDPEEAAAVRAALTALARETEVAIIVAERDLRACLGWCDRVVVLHAGRKIAEGAPETARRDPEVLDAYLGVEWRQ